MRILTDNEYYSEAEPKLRQVFLNENPKLPQFGSNAEEVKLLYEYFPPDVEVVNALISTASHMGDSSLYLSIVNIVDFNSSMTKHWWISFEEISTYLSINTDVFGLSYQLESVIFSPQGKWALMSSFERYAILAGTQNFIQNFSKHFSDIDKQIFGYLKIFRECINMDGIEKVNIAWLGDFLKSVYGIEKAKEILKVSELEKYVNLRS
ncbi:hypothetical protein FM036_03760 [Nostoc sp. HG1]|nr:hypothetical protein [Nostoc sp. HG1]